MQTKMKPNSIVTSVIDRERKTIVYSVGKPEWKLAPLTLHMSQMSAENLAHAPYHGMNQRVPDAAALPADDAPVRRNFPTDEAFTAAVEARAEARARLKHAKMVAVVEHYNSGSVDWNIGRTPTPPRPLDPIVLAAVGEVTGKSPEEVVAFIEKGAEKYGITKWEYLAKLEVTADVAPRVLAARQATVTPEMTLDDELAALRDAE